MDRTDKEKLEDYAIIKFNSGLLAILCSQCRKILRTGRDFTEEEKKAFNTHQWNIPPQYCEEHKPKV